MEQKKSSQKSPKSVNNKGFIPQQNSSKPFIQKGRVTAPRMTAVKRGNR